MFFIVPKMKGINELFKEGYEKSLNAKDEWICYFYKKRQIFDFIWSHIFMKRNAEDSLEHLWRNYKPLFLRVKSSSHVCSSDGYFFLKNRRIAIQYPLLETYKKLAVLEQ